MSSLSGITRVVHGGNIGVDKIGEWWKLLLEHRRYGGYGQS